MFYRSNSSQQIPLNIVGSNSFGRYPAINKEETYNMFISDDWLVNYAGYKLAIKASDLGGGEEGRALYASTVFNKLVAVIGFNVYFINIAVNKFGVPVRSTATFIGALQKNTGIVYIAENNKPQLLFSDNENLYIYDEHPLNGGNLFQIVTGLPFTPGYIDFHDTYFIAVGKGTPNWYISASNEGGNSAMPTPGTNDNWKKDQNSVSSLQTKPDIAQAVIRFPSRGNMVFVFGATVTESWFDVGAARFPYQRNNSFNIDYGCLNPATIARMDQLVVWLAINETSGPVIVYSDGGMIEPITTDGLDFLLANLSNPQDSQGFLFRQDGHIIYHINFYKDNLSLFYDFKTKKFFFATDENGNYFISSSVSFFNNQYFFVSKNNGNLYAFDTTFTDYDGQEIPRFRICRTIRLPTQDYFVVNDIGFTIESGETNYQQVDQGPLYLTTEDGKKYITEGSTIFFTTEDDKYLITEDGQNLISEQPDATDFNYLISEQNDIKNITPRVDLAISIDGGEHFSSYDRVDLPGIGQRKNKCMWWQCGAANSLTPKFAFWGIGRFVATDGIVNIRT